MMTAYHPLVAAKAMATIDHVSNGRFAANLVTGWNPADRRLFGTSALPREGQYRYADEWLSLIKRLWTEDEPFSFKGEFFDIEDAISQPKPIQRPGPLLMNAGGSAEGQAFVSKHCDMALVPSQTIEIMARNAADYRQKVRDESGREIQIWIQVNVVLRDSIAEAERYIDRYAVEYADNAYIDAAFNIFKDKLPPGRELPNETTTFRRSQGSGAGGRTLLGNADDIAGQIAEISEAGVDGLLLTWVDYQQGVRSFSREIMPKLVDRGLRLPFVPA
jgi:alkanesulfonate monooxygenase SsuD/methylene tetrahydromethanopterin reductase-like flavin-dependent oxidoreductase (luciferase family)